MRIANLAVDALLHPCPLRAAIVPVKVVDNMVRIRHLMVRIRYSTSPTDLPAIVSRKSTSKKQEPLKALEHLVLFVMSKPRRPSLLNLVAQQMSIVIKAQGEAQSAKLVGDAIKDNPGFIQLRRIDAAREIATTVARSQNKLFLNTESLLLDLAGKEGDTSMSGGSNKAKSSWR